MLCNVISQTTGDAAAAKGTSVIDQLVPRKASKSKRDKVKRSDSTTAVDDDVAAEDDDAPVVTMKQY